MSEPVAFHFSPLRPESVSSALSERNARRVLAGCVDAPRSAKELSARLGMPLATVYRQIHRLLDLAVLVPERSEITPDGKKVDLYRSRVLEAHLDVSSGAEEVRWRANEEVEAKLAAMWEEVHDQAAGAS